MNSTEPILKASNLILAILTALGLVCLGIAGFFKQIKSFSSGQKSSLFFF